MTDTTTYRICPLCEACCGLEVRTQAGRVTGIRGAAGDVFSAGYICPKGFALKDLHEDPDRLRQPLIKRNGRFEPASWDEAFAEIERRLPPLLQQHGRDAVALTIGNPSAHKMDLLLYFPRLARALGTRNVFSASTLDQMPKQLASGLLFGHWLSVAVPDIERSQHLLVIGANPVASNGSMWTVPDFRGKACALRARGGRLVVVDPRRTETAAVADEHHFIRPGADVYLLAAMVHTLFDEGLVRMGRLAAHVNGVDAVRAAVQPFAPERVAARCAIAAGEIRRLARELAAAERGCVYARIGTCTQRFGTVCSWLVDVLNVLAGKLDEPGGAMFSKAPAFAVNAAGAPEQQGRGRGVTTGRFHSRVSGAPEVFGELPMGCLAEEITAPGAGRVRGLVTLASNPVLSAPGGPALAQALDQLDFMVSVDIYLNETTRHADVILPGTSPLQQSHYDVAFPQLSHRNHARFSGAVFAPEPGHPAEWQVLLRLAAIALGREAADAASSREAADFASGREAVDVASGRNAADAASGCSAAADIDALDDELLAADLHRQASADAPRWLDALAGRRGPERLVDLALRTGPYGDRFGAATGGPGLSLQRVQDAPGGIDLGALEPRIPAMLRTRSGKVELAPDSCTADLQHALAELDAPAPPLVVIGRRDVRSNNSWMHNLPVLAKGPFRGTALVHPDDAAARGLADGAQARMTGPRGDAITVHVELSSSLMRGVVSLPHGWGHALPGTQQQLAAERPGANLNALLDAASRDPLSGNAVLSGVAVELRAVADVVADLVADGVTKGVTDGVKDGMQDGVQDGWAA